MAGREWRGGRAWARPPLPLEREADRIERDAIDWEAMRAEYMAGGIGLRALAAKYGVKPGTLMKRARAEGWTAARDGRGEGSVAVGDAQIAQRLRRTLLLKLERATDCMPCDATELKTQEDDGAVKLLKLRDLTAAYKELAGDLPADSGDGESRVVIDV